ncbi:MAG: dTDP-4-dehydrorhamnose 3,5-epimerase family protein [Planctomycetota bacterium]|jgi:dTDP-4-dehydrorhamnose 3,5-epimerase
MSIDFVVAESELMNGVWILEPSVSTDCRGNIWSSFIKDEIERLLPEGLFFKHDKFSESKHNVLRGIHGDSKSWKLVTCVYGEVHQVVVDMREDSSTYLKWQKFLINRDNQKLILIPPNMGNAYYVSSENAVYHYKLAYDGDYIDADQQFSVRWNDERIGVVWPTLEPLLSERDRNVS